MQHVQPTHSAPYLAHYAPHAQQAPQSVPAARTPGPLEMAVWMVYVEGAEVYGPVSAQQIVHAIRAGRLPTEASIQRDGEVFWVGLLDEPMIITALKTL